MAGARLFPIDVVTVSIVIATPPDTESNCSSWLKLMVEEEEEEEEVEEWGEEGGEEGDAGW